MTSNLLSTTPSRIAPDRGAGPRGRGSKTRGGGAVREDVPVAIAGHIKTVGVKRPGYGTGGRKVDTIVNAFDIHVPNKTIYHYNVVDSEKLPARVNMALFNRLQREFAAHIFTPEVYDGRKLEQKDRTLHPAVYDGRKNAFTTYQLPLGPNDFGQFEVTMKRERPPSGDARPPKVYKIKLTKVAEINTEILHCFVGGQLSQDNAVLTSIMALNVVIRMSPNLVFPFHARSFFPSDNRRLIGGGVELWRGYFQSIRPSQNKMYLNVDIATGIMFKEGPLIQLCLEYLDDGSKDPNRLSPRRLDDRERISLQRFLTNLRVLITYDSGRAEAPRPIQKLTPQGADAVMFTMRKGQSISVANYFHQELNGPLKFPQLICVEFQSGAKVPLELCTVPGGQFMCKQPTKNQTKAMVDFSKLRPNERLDSIRHGLEVLKHGQSDYVREFGMVVNPEPMVIKARILDPPVLRYGKGSKQPTIKPKNGQWNMLDKKFHLPMPVGSWIVIIYETPSRFSEQVDQMVTGFCKGAEAVGMRVEDRRPQVVWENGHGNIIQQLEKNYASFRQSKKKPPFLIVVVLPEGGDHIHTAVKHFGDIMVGVATQCLISRKCARAAPQYWAHVMLKVNVKLGGINNILDKSILNDPAIPTVVMGADVNHPAPGTRGIPSHVGVVSSVDQTTAKYIPASGAQMGRQEIIADLEAMVIGLLKDGYLKVEKGKKLPARLIFYRDGVSEGQFQHVLDGELPMIKSACKAVGIKPKITLIIVSKRHHIRMFPQKGEEDRSGNCQAGTTIDQGLGHPTDFDYYQLSHGGILGTSRPAHYSVIYDENNFSADTMQQISFSLCHVYARSTRSVSIPAPVAYAHIVCSRAKNHYTPRGDFNLSDTATQASSSAATQLEAFKADYKPLHKNQAGLMSFM